MKRHPASSASGCAAQPAVCHPHLDVRSVPEMMRGVDVLRTEEPARRRAPEPGSGALSEQHNA